MISRYTRKESQNPTVTKTFLVSSNLEVICRIKNEAKRSSHFGDIFMLKKSHNLIGQENFESKTQESDC